MDIETVVSASITSLTTTTTITRLISDLDSVYIYKCEIAKHLKWGKRTTCLYQTQSK